MDSKYWMGAEEAAKQGIIIFLNGQPITERVLGFEKRYTAGVAYWGWVCAVHRIVMGPELLNPVLHTSSVQGLLHWQVVEEVVSDASI